MEKRLKEFKLVVKWFFVVFFGFATLAGIRSFLFMDRSYDDLWVGALIGTVIAGLITFAAFKVKVE
jgi:hypothetical protein